MFIMTIKDLQASTVLGVLGWEKQSKRLVVLNLELHINTDHAGVSDEMNDSIDYAMIEDKILRRLDAANYNLIERLVTDIGQFVLSLDKRVAKVLVEADKPGALRMARSVSIKASFQA